MQVIVDLGENNAGSPATTGDAKAYKSSHGYSDPIQVVADPKWQKISQAVQHPGTSISLPYFVVFDSKMNILYIGSGGPGFSSVTGAVKQATGADFGGGGGSGGCDGYCGGQGPGCYCDGDCWGYGDCCADVCETCGFCNP